MLETPVDRLRGDVRRAGVIEERKDVCRAELDRAAEGGLLQQVLRYVAAQLLDDAFQDLLPRGGLVVPIGGDGALIDIPSDLDGDMVAMRVEDLLRVREWIRCFNGPTRCAQARHP